jgi:hypothetical protein
MLLPNIVLANSKLTPSIIDETFKIYDLCAYTSRAQIYNCDCVAASFLVIRQQNPRTNDLEILIRSAEQYCLDTALIAGEIYTECKSNMKPSVKAKSLESFCSCVGSEAAKEFMRNPELNDRARTTTMTKAYSACRVLGQ